MSERDVIAADEVREQAEQLAVDIVHGGFSGFEDAVAAVVDYFADEDESVGEEQARGIVTAVWSARLAQQRTWPEVTEAERLLAVLDELSERDIVAEPHFACCGRCGLAEIGGEATPDSRGFVFFHQQDTEGAVNGQGLMLAYGGFGECADQTAAIGREVTAALADAGLPVEWNGSPQQRLHVTPLEWRIRLTDPDARPGRQGPTDGLNAWANAREGGRSPAR